MNYRLVEYSYPRPTSHALATPWTDTPHLEMVKSMLPIANEEEPPKKVQRILSLPKSTEYPETYPHPEGIKRQLHRDKMIVPTQLNVKAKREP